MLEGINQSMLATESLALAHAHAEAKENSQGEAAKTVNNKLAHPKA